MGEPLVLLHPLGADHRMWAPVVERLDGRREVVALDLPGFGAAPPVSPSAPADLALAIGARIDALGLGRPHVAGNSLGGWVALELALVGRTRSVTAIAPAGLWRAPLAPRRSLARMAARAALPFLPFLPAGALHRALAGSVHRPERVPLAAARQLVRAYATAPGFRAANDAMRANVFRGLDAIRVPVTLVWPEFDRIVSRPRQLPANVRNLGLPGCGHLPTWDDPDAVAAALLAGSGG
jgi:pimeloyl-ACP methyl ester carboxylesterase